MLVRTEAARWRRRRRPRTSLRLNAKVRFGAAAEESLASCCSPAAARLQSNTSRTTIRGDHSQLPHRSPRDKMAEQGPASSSATHAAQLQRETLVIAVDDKAGRVQYISTGGTYFTRLPPEDYPWSSLQLWAETSAYGASLTSQKRRWLSIEREGVFAGMMSRVDGYPNLWQSMHYAQRPAKIVSRDNVSACKCQQEAKVDGGPGRYEHTQPRSHPLLLLLPLSSSRTCRRLCIDVPAHDSGY